MGKDIRQPTNPTFARRRFSLVLPALLLLVAIRSTASAYEKDLLDTGHETRHRIGSRVYGKTAEKLTPVSPEKARIGNHLMLWADIAGRSNPLAVFGVAGVQYRHVYDVDVERQIDWSYYMGSFFFAVNPAYAQTAVDFSWVPWAFLQLRVEYSAFWWFGAFGSLLAFPDGNSPFNWDVLDKMSGQEQKGVGQRLLFQPIVTLQYKFVVLRNQLDLAGVFFTGDGDYFFDQEYNVLVKRNKDLVTMNRTDLLFEAWDGPGNATFMLGPHYDVTWAMTADQLWQRIGLSFFCSPADHLSVFDHLRIYMFTGVVLQAPDPYYYLHPFVLEFGFGSDFEMF